MYLVSSAIMPEITAQVTAVLFSYESNSKDSFDVVTSKAQSEGKLAFDISASMKAVQALRDGVKLNTEDSVFTVGHDPRYD